MKINTFKLGIFVFLAIALLYANRLFATSSDRNVYLHYLIAAVFDRQNNIESAIEQYKQASRLDPDSAKIHFNLASDYIKLNKLDLAQKELESAVELDPDNLEIRFLLALVYSSLKNDDQAAQQYELILKKQAELEPDNVDIIIALAQLYYRQERLSEAIEQYRRVVKLIPDKAEAYLFLGVLLSNAGDLDGGITNIKKALALKPNYPEAQNSLGYLYAEKNENLDEALSLIKQALRDDADNAAYIDSLGWVYFKKGLIDKAIDQLGRAVMILKDPVIYDHLGDAYFAKKIYEKAKEMWQASLELDPNQEKIRDKLNALYRKAD